MIVISTNNNTTTPLGSGATYTGSSEDVSNYGTIRVMLRGNSSSSGTLYIGFSPDGSSWVETSHVVSNPETFTAIFVSPSQTYLRLRYVNGGVAQTSFRLQAELFSGDTFGGGGGGAAASVNVTHQRFVLDSGNISSKFVTLASPTINPTTVMVVPDGGPPQRPGIDFSVTSSTLSWSGLGLDGVLDINDVLEVTYYT